MATATTDTDFADGSCVRPDDDFPALWYAVTPGGQYLTDPDPCRRGKPTAKLYGGRAAAVAALVAAGFAGEGRS